MSDEPTDKPNRRRKVMLMVVIILALYPLSIGPLAFLQGAGILSDKAPDLIGPIYAPLRMLPPAVWALRAYEKECKRDRSRISPRGQASLNSRANPQLSFRMRPHYSVIR
jgi:hypothetical protein